MENVKKLLMKVTFMMLFMVMGVAFNSHDAKADLTVHNDKDGYYVNVSNASQLKEAGKLVAYGGNASFFGSHTLEIRVTENISGVDQIVIWGWKKIIASGDNYKITSKDYASNDQKNTFYVEGTLTFRGRSGTLTVSGGGTNKANKKAIVYVSPNSACVVGKNATLTNNANTVTGTAGAIYIGGENASATLDGGTISNCLGPTGAVYVADKCTFTMNSGTIKSNTGADNGGAVKVLEGGTFNMNGGTISNNTCYTEGGAVHNTGTFNMSGGTITNNTATKEGGGVRNKNQMTMTGGTISENKSLNEEGGGIFSGNTDMAAGKCKLKITSAIIQKNTTPRSGGGIGSYYGAYLEIGVQSTGSGGSGPLITGNKASNGGGIRCNGGDSSSSPKAGGNTVIYGGQITSNTATDSGAGISVGKGATGVGSTFFCGNTEVAANIASNNGGGIFVDDGVNVTVLGNNRVHDNGATSGSGGGIYIGTNCTVANAVDNNIFANSANNGCGGGIYTNSGISLNASDVFSARNAAKNGGHIAVGGNGRVVLDGYGAGQYNLTDGYASGSGGALYAEGNADLYHNVYVFKNYANQGGAIGINGGTVATYSDAGSVHIYLNTATTEGGGVHVGGGGRFLTRSENGNYAYPTYINENKSNSGGALYETKNAVQVMLINAQMYNNEATNTQTSGGAVYAGQLISIDRVTAFGNRAAGNGGFLYSAGSSSVYMERSNIYNNQGRNGAGMFINGSCTVGNTTITQNGGSVTLTEGNNIITSSYDHSSRYTLDGGGVFIDSSANFTTVNDSNEKVFITNNTADYGGGIYNIANTNRSVFYYSFPCGNVAINGGNIQNTGRLAFYNCEMNTGIATGTYGVGADGGCIYNASGVLELDGVKAYLNKTGTGGEHGGFLCNNEGATVYTARCEFYQNQGKFGGAIYSNGEAHIGSSSINTNGGSVSGDRYIAETYTTNGGAVYNDGAGKLYVTDTSYIDHNIATQNGGGIYNVGYFEPNALDAYLNRAEGLGGSLENTSSGITNGTNASFRASGAGYGAGVHNNGALTLNGGEISTNSATSGAGVANGNANHEENAIFTKESQFKRNNVTIET